MLRLTPNWSIDTPFDTRSGRVRPRKLASPSPPPARIVDVQVITSVAPAGLTADWAKTTDYSASKRIPPSHPAPPKTTCIDVPYLAANPQSASRAASYAAYRAWLRAQHEAAEASIMTSYLGQLDAYA